MADYVPWNVDWKNRVEGLLTPVAAEFLEHAETGIFNAQRRADDAYTLAGTKAAQTDIDAHNADTVAVHGIADTAALETLLGAQSKADAAQAAAATDATTKANAAKARGTHTGTQPISTVTETATGKIMTDVERTKLTSVQTNATQGLVMRVYNLATGFPVRGTLPTDTVVCWKNSINTTQPTIGGLYAVDNVDVMLIVSS